MSFKDIKDQEQPIALLRKVLENNNVAHAYLFTGLNGIGKALTAFTFAKALNCEKKGQDSCDICSSCRKIDAKNHPDIFRISSPEGEKAIKINNIRVLEDRIALRPYEARYKVSIIEDAHLMTAEAANSLLKTLEEPPADTVFILTTSNISRLFRTITSRCQVIKFSSLPPEAIESILIKKYGLRKEPAKFISRLNPGGIDSRAAIEGEGFIAWKNQVIDEFMNGSFFNETSIMFSSSKPEFIQVLTVLINWYRDMLILKNKATGDLIVNIDRMDDIRRHATLLTAGEIDDKLNALLEAWVARGQNVNQKLIIGALV